MFLAGWESHACCFLGRSEMVLFLLVVFLLGFLVSWFHGVFVDHNGLVVALLGVYNYNLQFQRKSLKVVLLDTFSDGFLSQGANLPTAVVF